jgi:glycosyltransferase involved in cell wall biosynthesis
VWGPINGGVPWPPGFTQAKHKEGEWLDYVRGAYRHMPGYRQTHRNAAAIIAGSSATLAQLPPSAQLRAVYIPENAIDEQVFAHAVSGPVRTPLRVAFVGRLVPYKGADMLLEATAQLVREGKLVLDIIGEGPERPNLEQQVQRLGIERGVRMEGWVEHPKLAVRLRESDVLGFPSVREFGGGVVIEAMALGLVPVIADYVGPAEHVTANTGYRVPMSSRAELIAGVKQVFEQLVRDPSELRAMGERGRRRVMDLYTWKAKAKQVLEVYRWVRGEREKPNFGMPLAP